jgi:hypothetical protein
MINARYSKSFLIRFNCLASTAYGAASVFATPWFLIPGVMHLAVATILLRKK